MTFPVLVMSQFWQFKKKQICKFLGKEYFIFYLMKFCDINLVTLSYTSHQTVKIKKSPIVFIRQQIYILFKCLLYLYECAECVCVCVCVYMYIYIYIHRVTQKKQNPYIFVEVIWVLFFGGSPCIYIYIYIYIYILAAFLHGNISDWTL